MDKVRWSLISAVIFLDRLDICNLEIELVNLALGLIEHRSLDCGRCIRLPCITSIMPPQQDLDPAHSAPSSTLDNHASELLQGCPG